MGAVRWLAASRLVDRLGHPQVRNGIGSDQQFESIEVPRHLRGRAARATRSVALRCVIDTVL